MPVEYTTITTTGVSKRVFPPPPDEGTTQIVWLVSKEFPHEGSAILGAYSTQELAVAAARRVCDGAWGSWVEVLSLELDSPAPAEAALALLVETEETLK